MPRSFEWFLFSVVIPAQAGIPDVAFTEILANIFIDRLVPGFRRDDEIFLLVWRHN